MRLTRRIEKNRMAAQTHSEICVLVLSLRSSKGRLGTRLALFTSKAVIKSFHKFSWMGAGHASSATVPSIAALTRHTQTHTQRGSGQDRTIPMPAGLPPQTVNTQQAKPTRFKPLHINWPGLHVSDWSPPQNPGDSLLPNPQQGSWHKITVPNSFNCQLFWSSSHSGFFRSWAARYF